MPDNRLTMAAATDIITSRTKYHNSPRWTGTWSTSKLVPIYANCSIRPGDTIKMRISSVIRSIQPVFPVMDDAFLSIECYFMKHKHLLSRKYMSPSVNDSNNSFKAWLGAQDSLLNMPLPDNDIRLPSFDIQNSSGHTYLKGGLADCLAFNPPTSPNTYQVNPFKVLTYYAIWNSYFREPSTQNPVTYTISSGKVLVTGTDAGISSSTYYASELPLCGICRDHGYFGSVLPWPQRNSDAIKLPLGLDAPVVVGATASVKSTDTSADAIRFWERDSSGNLSGVTSSAVPVFGGTSVNGSALDSSSDVTGTAYRGLVPSNLWADLSSATAATVNQVRYAFATQRWFEELARCGNRYEELVYGMTGVRQKDSSDDRPEYLGGKRIPITQSQVNTTAGASDTAGGTGSVGAFSHTADEDYFFTKSFDDFGTLMIVAFVRVKDTFHQGIAREDTVFDKFDLFWSQFANIGEVPIKTKEIYVTGNAASDETVFGYQEAWADYRLQLDHVTGYARPRTGVGNLYYLTYANDFNSAPTLKSFLTGSQVPNVDRTLVTDDATAGFQWFGQYMFDMDFIRQVPLYSIPGYIDHH